MLNIVKATIEKEQLIEKGDKIVVAVSGGPDSVALLHVLNALKTTYDISLVVCHLNHMLRGKDAEDDAVYVKELSESLELQCFIFEEDIEAYGKENKMSFEQAARERRYALFEQVKIETKAQKIAVAQNKNDQGETLLMRLMRGSGLEGLTGIKYKRDDIIRPLLNVSRQMIEAYCEDCELKTRIDKTNLEANYTRNKIRLELIPYIEAHFNPNIKNCLHQTASLLQADQAFIESYVASSMATIDKCKIPLNLLPEDEAIKSRWFRALIDHHAGDTKEVTYSQLQQLMALNRHGAKMIIKEITFEIGYDHLLIYKDEKKFNHSMQILNFTEDVPQGLFTISKAIPSDGQYIVIDESCVQGDLKIRYRQPGDVFKPLGMNGRKKLKDFFIDLKIPAHKRDDVMLLCDDEHIIWVVGYRLSDDFKVTSNTTKKIVIQYKPV